MRIAVTICALLALVAAAGCGGGKKTVSLGGTSVSTSSDDKSTTIQTQNGSLTVNASSADPAKLGAPIYPGATQGDANDGNGGAAAISMTTDAGTMDTAAFKSTDAFEKVYEFYKAQLPAGSEKMKVESDNSNVAMFQVGDQGSKDAVSVMIESKGTDGTRFTISHTVKSDSAMASSSPSAAPSPEASASSGGGE
jgi:hypothetical protein